MPKNQFSLEPGGPKRLEVSWSGFWKNVDVKFDGASIGGFPDKASLEKGGQFAAPDGSTIHVFLKTGMTAGLVIERNGQPLPGTSSDPETLVKTAAYIMYFVAAVNVGVGLFAGPAFGGMPTVAEGIIFGVLGFLTQKGNRAALAIGIGLYVLESVYGVANSVGAGRGGSAGIVMRVIFIMWFFRAWKASGQLRNEAQKKDREKRDSTTHPSSGSPTPPV